MKHKWNIILIVFTSQYLMDKILISIELK